MPLPKDKTERQSLAKRILAGEWSNRKTAAMAHGVHVSQVYALLKEYRSSQKQEVAVASTSDKDRIALLEHRLSEVMEECHTLQKLLMVVGRSL